MKHQMEKHPVVQDLESRFHQRLEDQAKAIRRSFPDVKTEVWSSSTESAADYQGHDIGIDCVIAGVPDNRPNCVALIIEVMHLTTEPKLCGAAVVWGHPSGAVEADLLDRGLVPYSEASIAIVEESLDDLTAALRKALRRGKPSDRPEH